MSTLHPDTVRETDFPTETLETEKDTQKIIFEQMLVQLEDHGLCRHVYHRLAMVLFGDSMMP